MREPTPSAPAPNLARGPLCQAWAGILPPLLRAFACEQVGEVLGLQELAGGRVGPEPCQRAGCVGSSVGCGLGANSPVGAGVGE